jgi:hypothetical protein
MSAEIINLKRVRKAKARAQKAEQAAQNRASFGQSKAERAAHEAEASRQAQALDGAERIPANEAGFSSSAGHDDEDLDPGNVS